MRESWIILGATSDIALKVLQLLDDKKIEEKPLIYAHCHSHTIDVDFNNLEVKEFQFDLDNEISVNNFLNSIDVDTVSHIMHFAAIPLEYKKIKQWDSDNMRKIMEVNVISFAKICSYVLPNMAKRREGKVFAMLSSVVEDNMPPKYMAEYVTSKYALKGLLKSLEAEYGEKGIEVLSLSPSMVETKFLKNIDQRIIEIDAAKIPGGRHLSVEIVAKEVIECLMNQRLE